MTIFYLIKKGYGTYDCISGLDSDDFLDMVEFEKINNAIERYVEKQANRDK